VFAKTFIFDSRTLTRSRLVTGPCGTRTRLYRWSCDRLDLTSFTQYRLNMGADDDLDLDALDREAKEFDKVSAANMPSSLMYVLDFELTLELCRIQRLAVCINPIFQTF
jgi:hypothetical protein